MTILSRELPIGALAMLVTLIQPTVAAQAPTTEAGGSRTIPVITGSVFYRERIALPPGAALEVTVEDVSRADAPAPVIGQSRFTPGGQVPIRFEVPYDPNRVRPEHRYALRARIVVGDRLLFTATGPYPVLTQGAGTQVGMMLMSRATSSGKGSANPDREPTDTYWRLTALHGRAVQAGEQRREAHIILQTENNRIVGFGGCNRLMGGYRLEGDTVDFSNVVSTQMACADGMEQETAFFQALQGARGWKIQGDALELLDQGGASVANFVAVDLK